MNPTMHKNMMKLGMNLEIRAILAFENVIGAECLGCMESDNDYAFSNGKSYFIAEMVVTLSNKIGFIGKMDEYGHIRFITDAPLSEGGLPIQVTRQDVKSFIGNLNDGKSKFYWIEEL